MIKSVVWLVLIFSLIIDACNTQPKKIQNTKNKETEKSTYDSNHFPDLTKLNFGQLFSYALTVKDEILLDSIYVILDDSLKSHGGYSFFSFENVRSRGKIFAAYTFGNEPFKIKDRNYFKINLYRNDSLFIDGSNKFESLEPDIKEFVANPENKLDLPVVTLEDVDFFGKVRITKRHLISIDAEIIPDASGKRASWELFLKVVNMTLNAYDQLRDELALKKWNKKYCELSLKKRKAIQQIYSLRILINIE